MKISILLVLALAWGACGDRPVYDHDDVDSAVVDVKVDSPAFSRMQNTATEVALPALIKSGDMQKRPGLMIDNQTGYELLPGEFEPESYRSVYCIGRSTITASVNALWFKLTSVGEYEEAPEIVDIMMVLYNKEGQPIDVYLVAHEALGHSYSYVRSDSVFTVEIDEMEDIIVTTSLASINESGFMPAPSETKTFKYGAAGQAESREYASDYLRSHGMNSNIELNQ